MCLRKKPILSDLKYNVNLQNTADKILMLYRPEYYGFLQDEEGNSNAGKLEVIIVKGNDEKLGEVKISF